MYYKKQIIPITIYFLLTISVSAQKLEATASESQFQWTGKAAFNSYSLTGTLQLEKAHIEIKNEEITALEVVVNMKSLHHENKDLKKHLRSKDFFDVDKFEVAKFSIDQTVLFTSNELQLKGHMTIKNKKVKEEINASLLRKGNRWILTFHTQLNRTLYGVNFNSPSIFKKLKDQAIDDLFTLKGSIVFSNNH